MRAEETPEEKKLREALKKEAAKVKPKGTLKDVQKKIADNKKKGK